MLDWKEPPTVKVTVHLSAEAARILEQYAGERSKGRFLSALLVDLRKRDDAAAEMGVDVAEHPRVHHAGNGRTKKRRR